MMEEEPKEPMLSFPMVLLVMVLLVYAFIALVLFVIYTVGG